MFQFPAFAPAFAGDRPSACRVAPFGYLRIITRLQFPSSPELFAAVHVLPRLRKPRHPPSALIAFLSSPALQSGPSPVRPFRRFFAGTAAFRPPYLPVLLFAYLVICSQYCQTTFRFFSNGLQRYGLFDYFQIFLNIFSFFNTALSFKICVAIQNRIRQAQPEQIP